MGKETKTLSHTKLSETLHSYSSISSFVGNTIRIPKAATEPVISNVLRSIVAPPKNSKTIIANKKYIRILYFEFMLIFQVNIFLIPQINYKSNC